MISSSRWLRQSRISFQILESLVLQASVATENDQVIDHRSWSTFGYVRRMHRPIHRDSTLRHPVSKNPGCSPHDHHDCGDQGIAYSRTKFGKYSKKTWIKQFVPEWWNVNGLTKTLSTGRTTPSSNVIVPSMRPSRLHILTWFTSSVSSTSRAEKMSALLATLLNAELVLQLKPNPSVHHDLSQNLTWTLTPTRIWMLMTQTLMIQSDDASVTSMSPEY